MNDGIAPGVVDLVNLERFPGRKSRSPSPARENPAQGASVPRPRKAPRP